MAWIESHQSIYRHPKVLKLGVVLGVPLDVVIGRLHLFWWWCLDYALNGRLDEFDEKVIESACDIKFSALIECGFVDKKPYLRVHDWIDYAGRFIKIKYKNYPDKIKKIERGYLEHPKGNPRGNPKTPNQPTLTNLYIEAVSIPEDLKEIETEIKTWLKYKQEKKQIYKPTGLESLWRRIRAIDPDKRAEAIEHSMSSGWTGIFEKNGKKEPDHLPSEVEKKLEELRNETRTR